MDLALNNLQRLICHKTQTNKLSYKLIYHLSDNCTLNSCINQYSIQNYLNSTNKKKMPSDNTNILYNISLFHCYINMD